MSQAIRISRLESADPDSGSIMTQPVTWDMFCNGMVILPDGRPLINGGTIQYDPFYGQPRNAVFDPLTNTFTDVQSMAHGRWYPTVTTLGDGRVMTFSGLKETGGTNTAVEIFTPGVGWSPEYPAGWTPPLYPRMHLLPDGRVLYSGSGTGSRIFNPSTHAWTGVVASTNYTGTRTYGTSVLLPLRPAAGYPARVLILGGGNPATATTEILDMSAPTPPVALRPVDVAGTYRDERDDPAQWQGPRDGRIVSRRGRHNSELQRRSLRPGHEYVLVGSRKRVRAPLSLECAAAARRHSAAHRWEPEPRELRTAHGNLLAGVPVQRRRAAPRCVLPSTA